MADDDLALKAAGRALLEAQALQRAGHPAEAFIRIEEAVALKPLDPGVLYLAGVFAHGLGRVESAEGLLQEARRIAPQSPEIAFAFGNLRLDQGEPREAEALFLETLGHSPGLVIARHRLSTALLRLGRHDDAERELLILKRSGGFSTEAALDLVALRLHRGAEDGVEPILRSTIAEMPDSARALFLLGDLSRRRGLIEPAAAAYLRALTTDFVNHTAWQGLALVRVAGGSTGSALAAFRRALALLPSDPTSWHTVAEIDRGTETWNKAAGAYRRVLATEPGRLDTLIHLGNVLDELNERRAAAAALRTAVDLAPFDITAISNLATIILQDGDIGDATRLYRQAATLAPDNSVAQYNLANAFRQDLDLSSALMRYRRAISIDPTYAAAHLNGAVTHLMRGNWTKGFADYEWRWRDRKAPLPVYAPWWKGEPLDGRRIFLLAEQGFGDMIHFARYARLVRQAGGRAILECYPELRRLFTTLGDDIDLVDVGASPGAVDLQVALMQLPLIFREAPADPYAPTSYLSPPNPGPALPRASSDLKVGFIWAGNPRIEKYHKRSAQLDELRPLIEMAGVSAYSLQVGARSADIAASGLGDRIIDLAPLISDFADTAALVDQLDLVIAVDTAVAHLAGALGKRVWMLPTYVPDWRWMLGRDDTPWYPSMRLYRQHADRRWPPVISRIASDLASLVAAQRTRTDRLPLNEDT